MIVEQISRPIIDPDFLRTLEIRQLSAWVSRMNDVCSPSLDSVEAGAPEQRIELTPEMIEAGCRELSRYRYDKSNDEEIVRAIFVAMGGFR